jgi:hypothetical protein
MYGSEVTAIPSTAFASMPLARSHIHITEHIVAFELPFGAVDEG